jgi:3'-5' exoribonuclease
MVSAQMRPDFPPRLRELLLHMIVSHHGELEFGSPKVPMFPEALLLHHLDNMDSKMECMRSLLERDRLVEGAWTGYSAVLGRTALKKRRFLEGPPVIEQPKPSKPPTPEPRPDPGGLFAAKLRGALTPDA